MPQERDAEACRVWRQEHAVSEDEYAGQVGPQWAEELSRLAVMIDARLSVGGWPAVDPGAESLTQMVRELLDRLLRTNDAQNWMWICDRMRSLLRFSTPAEFERFKDTFRVVVRSIIGEPEPRGLPSPNGKPRLPVSGSAEDDDHSVATIADFLPLLALVGGDAATRIMQLARDEKLSVEERMRAIARLDSRFKGYSSPHWALLLGVSDSAVRSKKNKFWAELRQRGSD
jgi:hypothetical protein